MDIHDGNVIQYEKGGLYYYYGVGYGGCRQFLNFGCAGEFLLGDCGFRINHTINLYTSPDLSRWTFIGDMLPWYGDRPVGIYYRPKVIYNRYTGMYVLWINRVPRTGPFDGPNFIDSSYVVATSRKPEGPFTVVRQKVETLAYGSPGDFALFVDDDDTEKPTGYIAYTSIDSLHRIQIEQLSSDYTDTLGTKATTGSITPMNNEAPIMFKRNGFYYLLFGESCCFCREGGNSYVFVSTHPLGPWTDAKYDIDPVRNEIIHGIIIRRSISGGQESFIVEAMLNNSSRAYIFVSDRWGSGPTKATDFQYWQPLQFNDTQTPPCIEELQWVDQFTLDIALS
ncbi:unnamed protein product [Rotaria sp. Silwood1]|nr:unnamed protein product [Rotaria sp. Silwood1]